MTLRGLPRRAAAGTVHDPLLIGLAAGDGLRTQQLVEDAAVSSSGCAPESVLGRLPRCRPIILGRTATCTRDWATRLLHEAEIGLEGEERPDSEPLRPGADLFARGADR